MREVGTLRFAHPAISANQIRCAVQVPEQSAPRQVPEPEVALRWPNPVARLMPLTNVTTMLPASATRPEADIIALVEATWPLLIPIDTLAPPPQALLVEAIWTFHSPSKVAAAAGVAADIPASIRIRAAITALRKCPMTCPCCWTRPRSHIVAPADVMGVTPTTATEILPRIPSHRRSTRPARSAISKKKAPPYRRGFWP